MIAKTTTGNNFEGAIAYGAGIRSGRSNKQAELISKANIGSEDAPGIAAEMRDVADWNDRIHRPVWHTSLSWAPGEVVSRAQKLKAAALYCELIGASLDRHQVAVYEHKDKPHEHLHIYINRVPMDGGPALALHNNYARNVKATAQIREQLGMTPLPETRQSLKDHSPEKQATRDLVQAALRAGLQDKQVTSLEQLQALLQRQGIEAQLKRDTNGMLVGVSFRAGKIAVTGTEVGYKGQQLRDYFAGEPTPALRTRQGREEAPAPKPGTSEQAAHPRSSDAQRQATRVYVNTAIKAALADKQVRSLDQLSQRLQQHGIESAYKRDETGILVGSAFRYQGTDVKGTEVGYKAQHLRTHLADEPTSAASPAIAAQEAAGARQDAHALPGALTFVLPPEAPSVDEAGANENERKRKRRRPKL